MLNGVILRVFLKGKIGKALSVCARIKQECRFVEVLPCFTSSIYCGIINKNHGMLVHINGRSAHEPSTVEY